MKVYQTGGFSGVWYYVVGTAWSVLVEYNGGHIRFMQHGDINTDDGDEVCTDYEIIDLIKRIKEIA